MEIIYFIMVVFTESTLSSVQINAWHIYADEVGMSVPCELAIENKKFQKIMSRKLRPGQKATLQCKSDPEMRALQFLLAPGAVRIDAASSQQIDSGDEEPGYVISPDDRPRTLTGKLEHVPYERGRKSTAAYLGQEFFLETKDFGRVALYPSDAVSKEQLLRRAGQTISVRAKFVDRTPTPTPDDPSSLVQYPIGPDGGPLKRAGYEVLGFK